MNLQLRVPPGKRGTEAHLACKNGCWHRKKMSILQTIASAAPTAVRSVKHWIYQLGGLGFIPLGLIDNSIIPLPGSMDVLTIFLSARNAAVALLRFYGDRRLCGRGLWHLQAGAQRGERNARAEVSAQDSGGFSPRHWTRYTRRLSVGAWAQSQFPPCYRRLCPCFHSCLARAPCNIR
jgi:hypothetical protein